VKVHSLIDQLANDPVVNADVIDVLKSSVKFEIRGAAFLDPHVQDYADLLLLAGLIKMPFPMCYFERLIQNEHGAAHLGLLVCESNNAVLIQTFICPSKGVWKFGKDFVDTCGWDAEGYYVAVDSEPSKVQRMVITTILSAIAFMDIRESVIEDVQVPPSTNHRRRQQGRSQLWSHKVLTITQAAKRALQAKGDRVLLERRAHWRRGHLRHLPNKIVPVSPALIRGEGFVSKDYRI
jgi:hypothetical protein